MSEHVSLRVICRDDLTTVRRPSDRDVNSIPTVQGHSPSVQVKEPDICNLKVTCRLIMQNYQSTQSKPEVMISVSEDRLVSVPGEGVLRGTCPRSTLYTLSKKGRK